MSDDDEPIKIKGMSNLAAILRANAAVARTGKYAKSSPKPPKPVSEPKKRAPKPKTTAQRQKIAQSLAQRAKDQVPRETSAILKPPKAANKPLITTDTMLAQRKLTKGVSTLLPPNVQQQILAQRVLARRRLVQFTKLTHPSYTPGWVHNDICARLERFSRDVADGKSPRLMLLCPPRHGKSEIASIRFPAWHLGHHPEHEIINVGYNLDLPMTFSRKVRDLMRTPHYEAMFPKTKLDPESQAVEKWMTTQGGGYLAAGVGGGITGKGCFSRDSLVDTPSDMGGSSREISQLRPGDIVYGFDHEQDRVVLTRVRAVSAATHATGTGSYVGLDCTGDHDIFVPGLGYLPAELVEKNDLPLLKRVDAQETKSIFGNPTHMPRAGESHYFIEDGARVLSFCESRSADSLEHLVQKDGYQTVFDIQTETGNFFVNGILVHNCHILVVDDPIKNQEEADSAGVRDKLWSWYQSTAYTRLAPGGGVLCIECMTGDTPVLMGDGTEKRLDLVQAGDIIATFENGRLATTTVAQQRSSGADYILKITMKSGKIVRANGRHPFLATTDKGELKWIRARGLSTANKIATIKGSGESGSGWGALLKDATPPPSAAVTAVNTTPERSGLMGIVRRLITPRISAPATLSIDTALLLPTTKASWLRKMARALFARRMVVVRATRNGGNTCSLSITVTLLAKSVGYSATTVMPELDILELSPSHLPLHDTSDFTLDEVISIEEDGIEEVFDVQVDRTTNFIANGAVSSNTWWSDDDLAGRLQNAHKTDELADKFEVVKYPAISEAHEYRVWPSMEIVRLPEPAVDEAHIMSESSDPEQEVTSTELIRPKNAALHTERYPLEALEKIRANLHPRIWSALYQQNPVPDEGLYFRKEYFKYVATMPEPTPGGQIFTAWDFAIATKEHNDWTVGVTLYRDVNDVCYVMDIFRIKADTFVMVEAMLDTAQRFTSAYRDCDYKLCVEDGQIWKTLKPVLDRRMHERHEYVSHDVMKPLTDKMTRARPLQARMQQGRLYWPTPEKYSWVDQAVHEMLRFPGGVHDDVVDALAWAARAVTLRAPPSAAAPVVVKSWRDKLSSLGHINGTSHMSA